MGLFRRFLVFTAGDDAHCVFDVTQGYIDILEKKYFNLTVTPDIEGDFNGDDPGTHSGLELPQNVLDKIYYDNMVKFLNFRYNYEKLSDVINESKVTYEKNGSRASDSRDKPDSSSESFGVSNNIYIAIDKKIAR